MTSYQKITSKAVLYRLPANQNDAPVYRVITPMKAALEAVKRMLKVVKGDLK